MTHEPEIECRECHGLGCPECAFEGWRLMSEDERDDAAEAQEQDRISGEPPMSLDEQHAAAWREKQALRDAQPYSTKGYP